MNADRNGFRGDGGEGIAGREDLILHVCTRQDWQAAQTGGEYRAASLDAEGFIHCSRPDQVLAVVNQFYSNVPDLTLLWIDPNQLLAELRWESVLDDEYPHIYGPLNLDAVQAVMPLSPDTDGVYRGLPKGM